MQDKEDIEFEDFSKAIEELTRKKNDDEGGFGQRGQEQIKKPMEL